MQLMVEDVIGKKRRKSQSSGTAAKTQTKNTLISEFRRADTLSLAREKILLLLLFLFPCLPILFLVHSLLLESSTPLESPLCFPIMKTSINYLQIYAIRVS